jgi:DNA-binding transcriptional ArsR family regulator
MNDRPLLPEDATDARELAELFKVLSVETRVRILQMLRERPLCVNALAGRVGVTHSAVSQHLRVLRGAGLVSAHKQGYFVHYRLQEKAVEDLRRVLHGFLAE